MKIQVMTHYDTIELIDARDLKCLIAERKILAFRRAGGWVKVGAEPLRGDGGAVYDGPERRNIIQKPLNDVQKRSTLHCVIGIRGNPQDF